MVDDGHIKTSWDNISFVMSVLFVLDVTDLCPCPISHDYDHQEDEDEDEGEGEDECR